MCDEMNVSLCLCKRSGLLRDGAPQIIYYCYRVEITAASRNSHRGKARATPRPSDITEVLVPVTRRGAGKHNWVLVSKHAHSV